MPDLYSVVHRELGPLCTFLTVQEAEDELANVLKYEPGWQADVWVEPFELVVKPWFRPSSPLLVALTLLEYLAGT